MTPQENERLLLSILEAVRTQSSTGAQFSSELTKALHEIDKKVAVAERAIVALEEAVERFDELDKKLIELKDKNSTINTQINVKLATISAAVSGLVAFVAKIWPGSP